MTAKSHELPTSQVSLLGDWRTRLARPSLRLHQSQALGLPFFPLPAAPEPEAGAVFRDPAAAATAVNVTGQAASSEGAFSCHHLKAWSCVCSGRVWRKGRRRRECVKGRGTVQRAELLLKFELPSPGRSEAGSTGMNPRGFGWGRGTF